MIESGKSLSIAINCCSSIALSAFPELCTYLVTYEYTEPALTGTVRVVFGELQPKERLPVSLPALYAIGYESRPLLLN
ncbi:MAG: hypothetical protein NVSMB27_40960 [Ktedonobacteraceae bacterium]